MCSNLTDVFKPDKCAVALMFEHFTSSLRNFKFDSNKPNRSGDQRHISSKKKRFKPFLTTQTHFFNRTYAKASQQGAVTTTVRIERIERLERLGDATRLGRFYVSPIQKGMATKSCPWVWSTRALVNSPTLSCLLIFSGGSRCTMPSISGASAYERPRDPFLPSAGA